MCLCVCVCARARVGIHACVRVCVRAYINAYVHTYVCAGVRARVFVRACEHVRVCVCLPVETWPCRADCPATPPEPPGVPANQRRRWSHVTWPCCPGWALTLVGEDQTQRGSYGSTEHVNMNSLALCGNVLNEREETQLASLSLSRSFSYLLTHSHIYPHPHSKPVVGFAATMGARQGRKLSVTKTM